MEQSQAKPRATFSPTVFLSLSLFLNLNLPLSLLLVPSSRPTPLDTHYILQHTGAQLYCCVISGSEPTGGKLRAEAVRASAINSLY